MTRKTSGSSRNNLTIRPGGRFSSLHLDVQAFLSDCEMRNLSPNTIVIYRRHLTKLTAWLGDNPLTAAELRAYFLELRANHSPGGRHLAFRVLRTFCRWRQREELVDVNPMERIRPPRVPDQVLEPLSLSDLAAMLSTCEQTFAGNRDRAMLQALLDTGCRAGEFVAINVGDVNLESGTIIIRSGKGGKSRAVFIGARVRRALLRHLRGRGPLRPEDPLWVTPSGSRLTYGGLRQVVRWRSAAAGIKPPSLHSFRRAFALLSLRAGADLVSLQRLLGHADLTILRRYLAQNQDDLRDVHSRTSPVDRLL